MTLTAGNAQTDPLFVLTPAFTTKEMGQTNPWPGGSNTLKVTLQTNVPMTADCATLFIVGIEGACFAGTGDRPINLAGTNAGAFKDLSETNAKGTWNSFQDKERGVTIGSLAFRPAATTAVGTAYEFEFTITNPVAGQNSPSIRAASAGIPISPDDGLFVKDEQTVLAAVSACSSYLPCRFKAGDAAPLAVFAPMFIQKDIGQSTPYPLMDNTLTVTLMTNLKLTVNALVTLSFHRHRRQWRDGFACLLGRRHREADHAGRHGDCCWHHHCLFVCAEESHVRAGVAGRVCAR